MVQKLDSGINPNVPYSLYLGLIPMWWKRVFWDQSQCLVQSVLGIEPNVMKNKALGLVPKACICVNWDISQTSSILTLGQIPVRYILGFWDKSQNYQRNNSGIGGLTTTDCLVSVPILPKTRVWDKSQPFKKHYFGISPNLSNILLLLSMELAKVSQRSSFHNFSIGWMV